MTPIVSRLNLPIHLKLCHFLACEVVMSLGLISSVRIVGGGVFEREEETVEGKTNRKTVTSCDWSPSLPGNNPASCWMDG